MTSQSIFFSAQKRFEAARRLPRVGTGSLHGHGFVARVVSASAAKATFSGSEADSLGETLDRAVAHLDHRLLNDWIREPEDSAVARWLIKQLDLTGPHALALRSAPDRGVIVKGDGPRLAWHRFRFEAAHRLPNVPAGHKCGRMHGHGFEAVIYVDAGDGDSSGPVQERIAAAWLPLHETFHLASLNDLPGLDNPTSEVLAGRIWQQLNDALTGLCGVTVMETPTAGCHFDGSGYRIWKSKSFDSAVRLRHAPEGDRRRMVHGHTFTARLHVSGELDEVLGWVYDYGDIKQQFDPVFRELDHHPLHEHPDLADNDPASIARLIETRLAAGLSNLSRVDVLNAPGCGALLSRTGAATGLLVP